LKRSRQNVNVATAQSDKLSSVDLVQTYSGYGQPAIAALLTATANSKSKGQKSKLTCSGKGLRPDERTP
jgi:hypothetical protein